MTDTDGSLLAVEASEAGRDTRSHDPVNHAEMQGSGLVHAADVQDRDGARGALKRSRARVR